jgi:HSP20 family protein
MFSSPFSDLHSDFLRFRRQMNHLFNDFDRHFGVDYNHLHALDEPLFHHHLLLAHPHLAQRQLNNDSNTEQSMQLESKGDANTNTNTNTNATPSTSTQLQSHQSQSQSQSQQQPALFSQLGWPRFSGLSSGLQQLPRVDIVENKTDYTVKCELAGMSKDDVKVSLTEDGVLTISAERSQSKEDKDEKAKYHRIERTYGTFKRSLQLPDNVIADKVAAKHEDGLLTITLPKKEQLPQPDKTRQIQIQ